MITEEKAKAYDEALERAKNIKSKILQSHLSTESCKAVSEYIDEIIPELRDSEDERTRKVIYKLLLDVREEIFTAQDEIVTKDKILAYLEKQKDASKAIEAVDRIDKYIDEHLANAHDMKDSNPYKKYYRGWDDALGKMAEILQDVYSDEKQKEQKPAEWSEEDEKIIDTIVSVLGQYIDYKAVSGTGTGYATPRYSKEIDWLKSLCPSWKPSDEQMDALKELIDDANRAGWVTPGATELYEQLKKL